MRLTAEQLIALVEFADGDDVIISPPAKGVMGNDIRTRIKVKRVDDVERVFIYDDGGTERVPANG